MGRADLTSEFLQLLRAILPVEDVPLPAPWLDPPGQGLDFLADSVIHLVFDAEEFLQKMLRLLQAPGLVVEAHEMLLLQFLDDGMRELTDAGVA